MFSARIQPFCKKYDINIGCSDETRINPRNMTQTKISLFLYNIQFCLIWNSVGISFNQAIKESKLNSKVVDNVISDKHVKSFVK